MAFICNLWRWYRSLPPRLQSHFPGYHFHATAVDLWAVRGVARKHRVVADEVDEAGHSSGEAVDRAAGCQRKGRAFGSSDTNPVGDVMNRVLVPERRQRMAQDDPLAERT